jgi:hypothetical protein
MTQEKEVQHMLLQEKYEKMDWASYGAQERREGDRNRLIRSARRMRKNGFSDLDIADNLDTSIDTIKEIFSSQPDDPALL